MPKFPRGHAIHTSLLQSKYQRILPVQYFQDWKIIFNKTIFLIFSTIRQMLYIFCWQIVFAFNN
ncbi:MAG: hypothetical protein CVU06_04595 [Bacteroidetes bacterium HGW-Bacteroidetes-22]|nr:MAG: hypothetical protein CVU06_04595 [Bacteroidetes bacterium HGW-Bacteroidetes-22]